MVHCVYLRCPKSVTNYPRSYNKSFPLIIGIGDVIEQLLTHKQLQVDENPTTRRNRPPTSRQMSEPVNVARNSQHD